MRMKMNQAEEVIPVLSLVLVPPEDTEVIEENRDSLMVFNATFNNISVISWLSVLLVEETGESHRFVASH